MILSRNHRFVFIKGHKVAGTSIELALSAVCGPDDILTPLPPVDERQRSYGARNYSERRELEAAYRQAVQTADIDPPRTVFYNHMPLREVEALVPLDGYRVIVAERSPYAKIMSHLGMKGFVPEQFADALDTVPLDAVRNIDLYRDATGSLRTDTVIRYQTLEHDVAALGLGPLVLPHAKRGLMSDTLDPRAHFRRDQLDRINEHYAEEFEAFGYARM